MRCSAIDREQHPFVTETTTYDLYGRTATTTDFKGQVTAYVYSDRLPTTDPGYSTLGRLTYKRSFASSAAMAAYNAGNTSQLGAQVAYAYDALGRQSSVTDPTGTTTYAYDPVTQQVSRVASPEGTIQYAYDPATGRHTRTWGSTQGGAVVTTDVSYGYDELGRLSAVTAAKLGGQDYTSSPLVTTYAYTATGTLGSVKLPNGVETDYAYDALNRLVKEVIKNATTLMQTYAYNLQADGSRTSALEVTYGTNNAVSSADQFQWSYDALDRLTQETQSGVDPATVNNPTPTLTATLYGDGYTLDLVGNRLTKVHADQNASRNETTTYAYNSRDQLTGETGTLSGTTTYGYDADGSTTSADNATTNSHTVYGYDLRNQLHTVTSNGTTTTYLYDDAGNKVAELSSSGNTYYLVDDHNPTGYSQELEESSTQGGTPSAGFESGSQILAQVKGGTLDYLLADGHGSTRVLTASSGVALERYTYDAYGNALGFNPAAAGTLHLFNAERFDPASGWYDQRARWYATKDGRFTSADSYMGSNGDPLSLHKYLYAGDNPLNAWDPSGHEESLVGQLNVNALQASLLTLGLLAFHASLQLAAHSTAVAREISEATRDIEDWISSSGSAIAAEGSELLGRAADVAIAIEDAIQQAYEAGRAALSALRKLKIFPIVRSAGPSVYAFDVAALASHPAWHVLTYNGLTPSGVSRTLTNRAYISSIYRKVPAPTGMQLDEFPYASTEQGGAGGPFGPALGEYVPAAENSFQGTLLFLFYHYELSWTPSSFLVVPVPV